VTAEQKKIALVAVAGGAGLLLLLYLLRSGAGAGGAGAGALSAAPLQIPPGSNILYNFPGFPEPSAVTAEPVPPSCTKVCDECEDNTAFAGVASYRIPAGTIAAQFRTAAAFVPGPSYPNIFAPVSLTWGTELGELL